MTESYKPIDWELCIKMSNNSSAIAKELLEMFIAELPETHEEIKRHYQTQNITELKAVVHKLHGGCCYIGAPKLKTIVEKMETLLKQNSNANIDSLYSELDAELNEIMKFVKEENYMQS